MEKVQPSPSVKKTKKVLISFLSYDQDSWEYKKEDISFRRSFYPDEPEKMPQSADEIWRPSVALAQLHDLDGAYPDLVFDDYYLLWDGLKKHEDLKEEIKRAIERLPSHPTLHIENPGISQPFEVGHVYQKLREYFADSKFHLPDTEYYVNCTNGTTAIRNCLFLLTQDRRIDALRIAPTPWKNHKQRDRRKEEHESYKENGRRWIRGSYTLENPENLASAESAICEKQANQTYKILKKGIITRDRSDLDNILRKVSKIIDRIKDIKDPSKRALETILLTGKTGVGKTQLARNIARAFSGQQEPNFQAINCATIRGADANIQKIELFGCTGDIGNTTKKVGALEKANGGVLFLDEIGELHPETQSMLLTALEIDPVSGMFKFIPLGGDAGDPAKSLFQLICGTNSNLEEGLFRRDLLNRINAWHFELPPLKDRRDDIPMNVEQLLKENGETYGMNTFEFQGNSKEVFLEFAKDPRITWDGNFRELNAMIRRMVILSGGHCITEQIVKDEIDEAKRRYGIVDGKEDAEAKPQEVFSQEVQEEATARTESQTHSYGPTTQDIHGIIDKDTYAKLSTKLSPVKKAELDVLIKLIQEEHITKQAELCSKVYCGSISANGGLCKRLKKNFGLRFALGRLEQVDASPEE